MATAILKELILNYILTVDEAIWLDKFIDIEVVSKEDDYDTLLESIKKILSKANTENKLKK